MENNIDASTRRRLTAWLVSQTIVIIFATILSFLCVELIANFSFESDNNQKNLFQILYRSGGTILPMAVILGALNNFLSKLIYNYVGTIADALKKIANGDFSIRLNSKKAGPFSIVYTNINKTAQELENVELLKTDFVNNYSHEFKTPITSIKGFAEILLEDQITLEKQEQYLRIIAEEAARLSEMSSMTILLSKLNAQAIITNQKNYFLDEQLRTCIILFLNEASKRHVEVDSHLETCHYYGNEDLMKHIWINLLSNAFKYTPDGGSIRIELLKVRKHIIVRIIDTGQGITISEQQQIFNPYYQGKTDTGKKGLGLGLSITKKIVDLCDGIIEISSKEGQGTTMTVKLPNLSSHFKEL